MIPPTMIELSNSKGRYNPTATANTGILKSEPRLLLILDQPMMINTPNIAPMLIIPQGRLPPKTPSATLCIKCSLRSSQCAPAVLQLWQDQSHLLHSMRLARNGMVKAAAITPTNCMICCRHGVAPRI